VAVMISRGCGGLPLSSYDTFGGHSKIDDIHAAVCAVRDRYPNNKIFLLGFSLGGAFSLKYLAKYNVTDATDSSSPIENAAIVTAAMCVSPPWDFHKATPVFPIWNFLLAFPLKQYFLRHFLWPLNTSTTNNEESEQKITSAMNASEKRNERNKKFLSSVGIWRVMMAMSLSQLDELLYPIFDESYQSVKCYYTAMSPVLDSHKINTPTIVVNAIDDPVCCHTGAPDNPDDLGPGLAVIKTRFGGHLGFPEGLLPLKDAWTDRLALEWFNQF